jgi:membrane fusion protein (multidrug efflux system)
MLWCSKPGSGFFAMRRFLAFTFVLILLIGLAGGLGYFQFIVKPAMIKGFISQAPRPVATVAATKAEQESWRPRLPAIGTFRAIRGIDIAPQVSGVITTLQFDSGQDVEKGAKLVQLDDSVEKADLANNTATLRNADLSLDRQRQLITGGSTARASLDTAQAQRDSAAAAVERTKALIAQKSLVAPFAGRLGLRKIDAGQYVSPGTSIVTLQQLDPILVDFPLPEQVLSDLSIGQQIEVSVDGFPGKVFKGKISSIDARVNAETRNITVRGEVENNERKLLPGMFASIGVLAGEEKEVVTLPRTAVSYSLYGDSVFVATPAAPPAGSAQAAPMPGDKVYAVERRVVKVGDTRSDRVAILDGVKAGDLVISEGQIKLAPGAQVKIDASGGLPPSPSPRPKE